MAYKTLELSLAADVADSGTVTGIAYPSGTNQAYFTGENASATGVAIVNGNDVYTEASADSTITYGASTITLTNGSGVTWPAGSTVLLQLDYLAGLDTEELDDVMASADEINRMADVSTRIVTIVASGALTNATHGDKVTLLGEVGGNALCAMTLPAATGTGTRFDLWVSVLNTSSYTITCDGSDEFRGSIKTHDNDSTAAVGYAAISGDNILTLNGGTTGGAVGDHIILVDALTGFWFVDGKTVVPIGSNIADPFS